MIDAASITAFTAALQAGVDRTADDADRIDQIRALEVLKCVAEAAQAVLAADLDASQRQRAADQGVPVERQGRGVAEQLALARRESPHRGRQHLALAKILAGGELPHTRAAFAAGRITEWRVTLVARETACLALADRQQIDTDLAGAPAPSGSRRWATPSW